MLGLLNFEPSVEQHDFLRDLCTYDEPFMISIDFECSFNDNADYMANVRKWEDLNEYDFDDIVGVFPASAIEAVHAFNGNVYTPLMCNGKFVRFAKLKGRD